MTFGTWWGRQHRPPLPPEIFMVLIFTRGWVDHRSMVRSEGNMLLKNPVTLPGIDPGTVRPVAQRLTTLPQTPSWNAVPSWSCAKVVCKPVWHIQLLSVQWINSWWWTDELSETYRVSRQNKLVKLVHLVGFTCIIKKSVTMHGYMNVKLKYRIYRKIRNAYANFSGGSTRKNYLEDLNTELVKVSK
jgi:hypothetical protein